jgi:hypothetical protein
MFVAVLALGACCLVVSPVHAQTSQPNASTGTAGVRDAFLATLDRLGAEHDAEVAGMDAQLQALGLDRALAAESLTDAMGVRQNETRIAAAAELLARRQEKYAAFVKKVETAALDNARGTGQDARLADRIRGARENDEALAKLLFEADSSLLAKIREINDYMKARVGSTQIQNGQIAFSVAEDRTAFLNMAAQYEGLRVKQRRLLAGKDALQIRRRRGWEEVIE